MISLKDVIITYSIPNIAIIPNDARKSYHLYPTTKWCFSFNLYKNKIILIINVKAMYDNIKSNINPMIIGGPLPNFKYATLLRNSLVSKNCKIFSLNIAITIIEPNIPIPKNFNNFFIIFSS